MSKMLTNVMMIEAMTDAIAVVYLAFIRFPSLFFSSRLRNGGAGSLIRCSTGRLNNLHPPSMSRGLCGVSWRCMSVLDCLSCPIGVVQMPTACFDVSGL